MIQEITPERTVFHTGDVVTFRFSIRREHPSGRAVVRTNLGNARLQHLEAIRRIDRNVPEVDGPWRDLPMDEAGTNDEWRLTLPLPEPGVFEAKCCFIPDDGSAILWPESDNFRFKVLSAATVAGNTVYCAFVRQFGGNLRLPHAPPQPDGVEQLDLDGYTVIPPSGTFRQLIANLDHIFSLGCRIVQLLPIHPVPAQYGRMGRYGSPFAAIDYFNVDPALADFDVRRTPMEQFEELVDAVHARRGRIFLDIPVNHTGWASKLQIEHPDYFVRAADGAFESPGAWGVTWADLCRLDYRDPRVCRVMAKVFLFWCRRGVDGFRCDAGYMVPEEAWSYIVSRVREEYPDTLFLLEGLGGPEATERRLLGGVGLDWGYSELFQNYSAAEIRSYYPRMLDICEHCGTLINFAETHDNNRLAATGREFSRLRFLVNALLSVDGAFGFANGAEFFATEKIDVHGNGALNFGAEPNLTQLIRRLNALLNHHPAFAAGVPVRIISAPEGNTLAVLRGDGTRAVLVLINTGEVPETVFWPIVKTPGHGFDEIASSPIEFKTAGDMYEVALAALDAKCVRFDLGSREEFPAEGEPELIRRRRAAAVAQQAAVAIKGFAAAAGANGMKLLADPEEFVTGLGGRYVSWHLPEDARREVMLAPGDLLLVRGRNHFRCEAWCEDRVVAGAVSITGDDGEEFALLAFPGIPEIRKARRLRFRICAYDREWRAEHLAGEVVLLPEGTSGEIRLAFPGAEAAGRYAFGSNSGGGYVLTAAEWGKLISKYSALLAANCNADFPVDRRVMFTRCRAWLVINDYSREINHESLLRFTTSVDNRARWEFAIAGGQGCRAFLNIEMLFAPDRDAVRLIFSLGELRLSGGMAGVTAAKLILRPDIEDRINHEVTRAYTGPEHVFPAAVKTDERGFDFAPGPRRLSLRVDRGTFVSQPEWRYQQDLSFERYYGLADKTDLFSPGYFEIHLREGSRGVLDASVTTDGSSPAGNFPAPAALPENGFPEQILPGALRRFVVKRGKRSSVIAGYPWFLDWGRDTLIALRGLCRCGEFHVAAADILCEFATFEEGGTIPNVIHGSEIGNRDTVDAPLWLIVATRDYVDAVGSREILDADCGGRKLREVLESIVENYRRGTANGISMDEASGLIYSPSHFTWMDTNYPAGTPREGYPVEIQALWYASLVFLGFEELANRVKSSVEKYYFTGRTGGASDCLHCGAGTPAAAASPDDHIRPNQLSAVTLGAVGERYYERILRACSRLLVPGAIRTLADCDTSFRLPVELNGRLLNDPGHPYRGHYCGPEDTSRKVAYHNGTAWCWPFPSYCEALYIARGESERGRALSLLMSMVDTLETPVPGQFPEVVDGDAPHTAGGCPAQAWSLSEFYRVWKLLRQPDCHSDESFHQA